MAKAPEGFDLTDPDIQQAPHGHYAYMRSDGVQYIPANDAWVVLRHEDCLTVLRDPATYSSQLGSNRQQPSPAAQAEIERIGAKRQGSAPAPHPARQRPTRPHHLPPPRVAGVHTPQDGRAAPVRGVAV